MPRSTTAGQASPIASSRDRRLRREAFQLLLSCTPARSAAQLRVSADDCSLGRVDAGDSNGDLWIAQIGPADWSGGRSVAPELGRRGGVDATTDTFVIVLGAAASERARVRLRERGADEVIAYRSRPEVAPRSGSCCFAGPRALPKW